MTKLHSVRIDELEATIGGTSYPLTSVRVRMAVNQPSSAELVLAQGIDPFGKKRFNSPKKFDSAFTSVVVRIKIDGATDGLVVFTGFVSTVSRTAANNVSGSYTGTVVNCLSAVSTLRTITVQGYRYWGTAYEGNGAAAATIDAFGRSALLQRINTDNFFVNIGVYEKDPRLVNGVVPFIVNALSILTQHLSNKRFGTDVVTTHINERGRETQIIKEIYLDSRSHPESRLLQRLKKYALESDPYTALSAMLKSTMFFNMVPTTGGQVDPIPAFPWAKKAVATVKRGDIIALSNNQTLSAEQDIVDAIFVPTLYGPAGVPQFQSYPDTSAMPDAGISKVVSIPDWLNPFLDKLNNADAAEEPTTDVLKNSKKAKLKTDQAQKNIEVAETVAKALARAFFSEVKNSGVSLTIKLPWYRLEFLDALGYLMKIEQPHVGTGDDEVLYGFLAGGVFKASSTAGGSSASLELTTTHIRSEATNDTYGLDKHPLYTIDKDPVKDKLAAIIDRSGRVMSRSEQKDIGGDPDAYLTKVKEATNK